MKSSLNWPCNMTAVVVCTIGLRAVLVELIDGVVEVLLVALLVQHTGVLIQNSRALLIAKINSASRGRPDVGIGYRDRRANQGLGLVGGLTRGE